MAGVAFVVAEARGPDEWQAEARFLVQNARSLYSLLEAAQLADRGLPTTGGNAASVTVQTDLLFEEGEVSHHTFVTFSELPRLSIHAALEDYPRLAAWDGFLRALEQSGRAARLMIWFVW